MINVAELRDTVKKIHANLKSVKNLPPPDVNFENLFTLNELEACLSLPEKQIETALTTFLKKRWYRINNTPLAYPNSPKHPINLLCLDIAKKLPPQVNDMGPYLYLMPTLWGNLDYGVDINTLSFNQFIISADGQHFIPVIQGLNYLVTYKINNMLTSTNDERLITLSTHTQAYFEKLCELKAHIRLFIKPEGKAYLNDALSFEENILRQSLRKDITSRELHFLSEILDLDFLWGGFNSNEHSIEEMASIDFEIYNDLYKLLFASAKLPEMNQQEREALLRKIQKTQAKLINDPRKNVELLEPGEYFTALLKKIESLSPDFESVLKAADEVIKKREAVQGCDNNRSPESNFRNSILSVLTSWETDPPCEHEKAAFLTTIKNTSDTVLDYPLSKGVLLADKLKDPTIVADLINAGANVNSHEGNTTPLMTAISLSNLQLVKFLLENHAELTKEALLLANLKGETTILTQVLLHAAALPDDKISSLLENSGQTNLMCWVGQRCPQILSKFLTELELQHNLDCSLLSKKNQDGKTPFELVGGNPEAMYAILNRQLVHAIKNRQPHEVIRILTERNNHNLLNSKDFEKAQKLCLTHEMLSLGKILNVYKSIRELYEYGTQLKTDRTHHIRKSGLIICHQAHDFKQKINNFALAIFNFDSKYETESMNKVEHARKEFSLAFEKKEEAQICSMIFERLKSTATGWGFLEPETSHISSNEKTEGTKEYKNLFKNLKNSFQETTNLKPLQVGKDNPSANFFDEKEDD
jgi:ankyrin repeat protein